MNPPELFASDPAPPCWVHGKWMGTDQDGGLWIRKDAELKAEMPFLTSLSHVVLTSDRKTGLDPGDRSGPAWNHFASLQAGSIGSGWIAVD